MALEGIGIEDWELGASDVPLNPIAAVCVRPVADRDLVRYPEGDADKLADQDVTI